MKGAQRRRGEMLASARALRRKEAIDSQWDVSDGVPVTVGGTRDWGRVPTQSR